MSANCVPMSCTALPVMMFEFGWAEPSGVQPIRPPPPEPTDSGLPVDSPSTQEAMPAAAAFEYPLSTRYWATASRLLPLAISDCTAALPPDEGCVLPPDEGCVLVPDEGCVLVPPDEGCVLPSSDDCVLPSEDDCVLVLPWEGVVVLDADMSGVVGSGVDRSVVDRSHVDGCGAVATCWSE